MKIRTINKLIILININLFIIIYFNPKNNKIKNKENLLKLIKIIINRIKINYIKVVGKLKMNNIYIILF